MAVAFVMAGCAGPGHGVHDGEVAARRVVEEPSVNATVSTASAITEPSAQVIATATPVECVPYARRIANISIHGNAWSWWRSAAGRYPRDERPTIGAILVWKRTSRLRYGHVAVVSRVLNSRQILVDHANWLNRGQIQKDVPVIDVSANNDWSVVRVWFAPGNTMGKRQYPAYGFIHPGQPRLLRLQRPPMQGPDVRFLQEKLIREGFKIAADGVFGPKTRDALAKYQARNEIGQDGMPSDITRAKLGF